MQRRQWVGVTFGLSANCLVRLALLQSYLFACEKLRLIIYFFCYALLWHLRALTLQRYFVKPFKDKLYGNKELEQRLNGQSIGRGCVERTFGRVCME